MVVIAVGCALTACGPTVPDAGDTADTAAESSSSSGAPADPTMGVAVSTGELTTTTDPVDPTMATSSTTTGDDATGGSTTWMDDTNDTTCGFYGGCPVDGGGVSYECDVYMNDCGKGEKCAPWANDGGSAWNATRCVPVDAAPAQPGDTCTVEGSGVSGIDTCDVSSMCWDVDPETNEGTCVAFCTGSENAPVCDDPTTSCSIANEGVLILCLPTCDPILQDCADGQACYPIDDSFVCAPDASGEDQGADNDPCEFINACDPGNICVNPDIVDGCPAGSAGCCQAVCDLSEAMPAGCTGSETCEPWFEEGNVPPGYEDVGVCALPV